MRWFFEYACGCPGRPGAAEPFEPRQDREVATVRKCFWVPPVACPDISFPISRFLWQNNPMPRWIQFTLALILGLAGGLIYGWVISPVEYVDTTPDTLRQDFRVDYVLMVAETYAIDGDLNQAGHQMAVLGSENPSKLAAYALDYAQKNNYSPDEQELLHRLALDLLAWQPTTGGMAP